MIFLLLLLPLLPLLLMLICSLLNFLFYKAFFVLIFPFYIAFPRMFPHLYVGESTLDVGFPKSNEEYDFIL